MKGLAVAYLLIAVIMIKSNSLELNGIYAINSDGTEYVYQLPESALGRSHPAVGVVFLAHGCSHSSTDFWPQSASCPKCIGLPVEVEITSEVLKRNMIALAVSSANRDHKCWGIEDRTGKLVRLIQLVYKNVLKIDSRLPLFMFGASSGGRYVGMISSQFAIATASADQLSEARSGADTKTIPPTDRDRDIVAELPLAGTIIQICPFRVHAYSSNKGKQLDGPKYRPPIVFIHMPRDVRSARGVSDGVAQLHSLGVPVAEYKAQPKSLSYELFTLSRSTPIEYSMALVSSLKKAGYLDSAGMLIEDPRHSDWRKVVGAGLNGTDNMEPDKSAISELLNLAYAQHEITHEYVSTALDWLMMNNSFAPSLSPRLPTAAIDSSFISKTHTLQTNMKTSPLQANTEDANSDTTSSLQTVNRPRPSLFSSAVNWIHSLISGAGDL